MNRYVKTAIGLLFTIFANVIAVYSQDEVQMADTLRSEGKIYVVVIMILIVLLGLILYLFLMDRKVKKLEKLLSDKAKQTN